MLPEYGATQPSVNELLMQAAVMIDISKNGLKSEAIYAIAVEGAIQLKQLTPMPNDEVRVTSTNPDYFDYTVKVSDLEIIGKVVWLKRSLA
jgi:phage repressor protein C with HTH and peptisase S24 domain